MSDECFEIVAAEVVPEGRESRDATKPGYWARCMQCGDTTGPFLALMKSEQPTEPVIWCESMYCRECVAVAIDIYPRHRQLVDAIEIVLTIAGRSAIRSIIED